MKKRHLILCIGWLAAASCNRPSDPEVSAKKERYDERREEAREAGKDYYEAEKDQLVKDLELRKERINARLDELRARSRKEKNEAKAATDREISEWEARRDRIDIKLDEAKKSTREGWESFKRDVKELQQDMENNWNRNMNDDTMNYK